MLPGKVCKDETFEEGGGSQGKKPHAMPAKRARAAPVAQTTIVISSEVPTTPQCDKTVGDASPQLDELVLADITVAWEALGGAVPLAAYSSGGCTSSLPLTALGSGGCASSSALTTLPPLITSHSSKSEIKEALFAKWQENERQRAAMVKLFSQHQDLTPDRADATMRWHMHGCQSASSSANGLLAHLSHSPYLLSSTRSPFSSFKRVRRMRTNGETPSIELEQLPDSILSYIYSFAPQKVCLDLSVSKRWNRCLTKAEAVFLDVKSGAEVLFVPLSLLPSLASPTPPTLLSLPPLPPSPTSSSTCSSAQYTSFSFVTLLSSKHYQVSESALMRFETGVSLMGKRCWGLADKVTSALKLGWTALVSLDLSDNEIDDEITKHLSLALQCCTNLTSLSLCDNKVSGVGASHLGTALAKFVRLEKLNLTGNR